MVTCPNCSYEIVNLIKIKKKVTEIIEGFVCSIERGDVLVCESKPHIDASEEKTIELYYCPLCDYFLFNNRVLAEAFLKKGKS